MINKNILRIINEEISDFDFLGGDKMSKEYEYNTILSNEKIQKQFICDSLLNKERIKLSIKDSMINGNWEDYDEDANKLTLEYELNVQYIHGDASQPLKFNLIFYSDNIQIRKRTLSNSGDYNTEPYGESWFEYIDWDDISVQIINNDGVEIKFVAFEKAPKNIQEMFIKRYVLDYIETATNMDIKNRNINYNLMRSYC